MTAVVETRTCIELVRWCNSCGCPATAVGWHLSDGSFDPYSVMVSDEEIEQSSMGYARARFKNWRDIARENIARGKHLGTRRNYRGL